MFSLVNHAAVKRVLATECLARAGTYNFLSVLLRNPLNCASIAKLHMNEVWRQLKSPNDDDYRTSLTDLLNTLLGGNSANFWRTRGRDCLQRVFVRPRGIAGELPDPVPLLDKPALLQRLREMLNFNVRTSLPEGADQPFQVTLVKRYDRSSSVNASLFSSVAISAKYFPSFATSTESVSKK